MTDNTLVRAAHECPICYGDKPVGNVACWSCYRTFDMRYGNAIADQIIRNTEDRLRLAA
jgi:hypothetical protein